jgi:predicted TIM-barrel fold metal-dependent hydrolase
MVFIASHLASLEWNVDSLAAWFDRFPNAAADISARTSHLQVQTREDRERVRNFMIKYQDRLLYGTDVTYHGTNSEEFKKDLHERWLSDWKYFTSDEVMTVPDFSGEFKGLQLPKEVVNKLYNDNAVKWYNLKINQ